MAIARSTWRRWRIGWLCATVADTEEHEGHMTAKHVDYYLSLNSPWAYLGSKRFEVIAKKYNADVTIWPVDFGSVFAVSGGLPLPKRAPQRQAYRMMELKRWRDHLGVKITLEPKYFPSNEVPAAQCVIALREQGRMADAIKLAHAVMKAGNTPEMAAKREAYTKAAIDKGVFGAPSFLIDGELFWGQDRLDFVE